MQLIQSEIQKNRALEILSTAFYTSPGITWMIGENQKEKKIKKLLSLFLFEASLNQGAYLTADNNGVVLFFQLQHQRKSIYLTISKLYAFFFVIGVNRGIKAMRYKKIVDDIRPKTGWMGWLVATDNSVVGNVAAYEIKNFMFNQSNHSQETIYVETTVPRVRLLYRAAGYEQYAHIKHPYQDIDVWFMKRDPLIQK
jgi:hypothetical protein